MQSFRGRKRESLVKGDVSVLLFRYSKTQRAYQIFLGWLKNNGCEVTPHEISQFGQDLHDGKIVKGFKYQRKSFYSTILKRLLDLGFISKQSRYPHRVVYAPVFQPIPKRAPVLTSWYGLAHLTVSKGCSLFLTN